MTLSALFQRLCGPAAPSPAEPQEDAAMSSCSSDRNDSDADGEPSSSGSSSTEMGRQEPVLTVQQKRKMQTAAARKAALEAKMKRKVMKEMAVSDMLVKTAAEEFVPDLQPNCDLNKPGRHRRKDRHRRLRLIMSYLQAVCTAINALFEGDQSPKIAHILGVSVLDDTNIRLSRTVQGQWQSSRVVTVLNNWQMCTACYTSPAEGHQDPFQRCWAHRSFALHTPPTCLPRANAPAICLELKSWMFSFAGEVGKRWQALGVSSNLFATVPIVAQVLCYDSLKTNLKIVKMLREELYRKQDVQDRSATATCVMFGTLCSIHQLALCRRGLLFYYTGFWSSIVRLSHLFTVHNFRAQFRSALFSVLVENFQVISIQSLPPAHLDWAHERKRLCGILNGSKSQRISQHLLLMKVDNGDINSLQFTHWCSQNECCHGNSEEERADYCLMMMCKYYCHLFGFGFHVPLAYRWKHAKPALEYCQDPSLSFVCTFRIKWW